MQNNQPKILIRFDDICPTMSWEMWNKAEKVIDKYGIKPLIGVIPDCKDPDLHIEAARTDFWTWLKQKQNEGYAIAMHGYNHTFCSPHRGILNYRYNSEFAGLSLEEQEMKIRLGKEILSFHGIETDIFFAPAHSYDENTLKALYRNGFRFISDGKSTKAYKLHGITCIPCLSSGAGKIPSKGYHTSVFHAHEWLREDKACEYSRFVQVLERYHSQCTTWNDYKVQPIGATTLMRMIEKLVVFWICKIRPVLVHIFLFFRSKK